MDVRETRSQGALFSNGRFNHPSCSRQLQISFELFLIIDAQRQSFPRRREKARNHRKSKQLRDISPSEHSPSFSMRNNALGTVNGKDLRRNGSIDSCCYLVSSSTLTARRDREARSRLCEMGEQAVAAAFPAYGSRRVNNKCSRPSRAQHRRRGKRL